MSAPNYALDLSLAKGANAQGAVLNFGTDTNIVLDGNLAIGDLVLLGTSIELAAATSVGAPVLLDVFNQTATGQSLQISAGGPGDATNTGSIIMGPQVLGNALVIAASPVNGTTVTANTVLTGVQMATSGPTGYVAVPCPVAVTGDVANFTPVGPNGPLVPGLYSVLIGPGTDAGVNAQAYTSAIVYLDNTGAWAAGGSSFTSPTIGAELTGCFTTRLTAPPSNQMVFVNGANFNTTAGQVNIYFRCLFSTVPGTTFIPPFGGV